MINLAEMQFELLDGDEGPAGVPFGIGLGVSIDAEGFDPGGLDWLTQDSVSSTRGTTHFGTDVPIAQLWLWSAHLNREDAESALASLAELSRAWRAARVNAAPGAVSCLRYRVGGRTRRVYGRPRRLASPPDNMLLSGYAPVTMDFQRSNDLHYGDDLQRATLALHSASEGGLILPTILPADTLPSGRRDGNLLVGGDAETQPKIRFDGPVSHPFLETSQWRLDWREEIPIGQYVEIDTRPWALSVTKNGAPYPASKLGRRQYLSEISLAPGQSDLRFGGASVTGGGTCTVEWRDAWQSL